MVFEANHLAIFVDTFSMPRRTNTTKRRNDLQKLVLINHASFDVREILFGKVMGIKVATPISGCLAGYLARRVNTVTKMLELGKDRSVKIHLEDVIQKSRGKPPRSFRCSGSITMSRNIACIEVCLENM